MQVNGHCVVVCETAPVDLQTPKARRLQCETPSQNAARPIELGREHHWRRSASWPTQGRDARRAQREGDVKRRGAPGFPAVPTVNTRSGAGAVRTSGDRGGGAHSITPGRDAIDTTSIIQSAPRRARAPGKQCVCVCVGGGGAGGQTQGKHRRQ